MIFGQRLRVTDLVLYPWIPAKSYVLRAIASLELFWRRCARKLPASPKGDLQLVTALTAGIFMGSGAAMLLTEQAVIALALVAPICALAMLQLPRQQRAEQQREQTLPKQDGQKHSGVISYLADEETMMPLIEDALRHLYDHSYLGQHQLSQLYVVQHKWTHSNVPCWKTHLSLGHALHALLVDVIEQLRPKGTLPTGAVIPSREWYPYLILHGSYVQGELTREIMARLCIGEGTYNRTRRRALHSIALVLLEMENQTREQNHLELA
jgi:hypothetical protein